ncbi:hypothetical protein [Nonomuraea rhizosphaerae]|uniref:hypothetical protein n=1 Tax=Nonomuraea rhizosphaerae TaxID=2665663 RepID=UPI001C5FE233|nr:hypothetical protein [Nonomuraea rhizosphaerae]
MTLAGIKYDGITRLRTGSGMRDMLRFTMDRAVLDAPRQSGGGVALRAGRLTLGPRVVVYLRAFDGRLSGLVRLRLSADRPDLVTLALKPLPKPPLPITLTDVTIDRPVVVAGAARITALDIVSARQSYPP